jgi:hypothetical protein
VATIPIAGQADGNDLYRAENHGAVTSEWASSGDHLALVFDATEPGELAAAIQRFDRSVKASAG